MNSVSLVGRLTRDPELRHSEGESRVAVMRLAVPRRPREGQDDPGAVYVDVVAFAKLAQVCVDYLAKGRRVGVTGRLEHFEWTDEGGRMRSRHEVIAQNIDFLDQREGVGVVPIEGEEESSTGA